MSSKLSKVRLYINTGDTLLTITKGIFKLQIPISAALDSNQICCALYLFFPGQNSSYIFKHLVVGEYLVYKELEFTMKIQS